MLAIRSGRLFDGDSFSTGPVTVLVGAGRISGIESGFPELGDGWTEARFDDATVLPGLIDTHVHLVGDSGDRALSRVPGYSDQELDDVISDGLQRQLAAGVTTVRDLGDDGSTWQTADAHAPLTRLRRSRQFWRRDRR
jgi:imidazolonepropionase-like amidohydrolase